MIYKNVCDEQTVHILQNDTPYRFRDKDGHKCLSNKAYQLQHAICCASVSEEAQQIIFDSPSATWSNDSNENPHTKCCSKESNKGSFAENIAKPFSNKMDLSFLRTCRQLYDEARLVPYETLTFSFRKSEVLKLFMKKTPQAIRIRHLRLEIDIGVKHDPYNPIPNPISNTSDFQAWHASLRTISRKMKNLQYIHLDIKQDEEREAPFSRKVKDGGQDEVTTGLLIFRKVPLEVATVTLRDQCRRCYPDHDSWRIWDGRRMITERQSWAKAVREGLFG